MLRAQRAANAGEADVEVFTLEFAGGYAALDTCERGVDGDLDPGFEFVNELTGVALGFFGSGLQPQVVDLRRDAVFAREPAVAEDLVVVIAVDGGGFEFKRRNEIARG